MVDLAHKKEPPRDEEAEKKAKAVRESEVYVSGAFAYAKYCALCHGANAEGYAADHAPSLRNPTFLASVADEYIARGIRDGRPGTAMAGYGANRGGPLGENEIASLVTFIRAGDAPTPVKQAVIVGDADRGATVYANTCRPCHGTPGERGEAVHLANSVLLASASDSFLRYAVEHGRPGTPMPSFHATLSDEDADNVISMLRSWATPPPPSRARNGAEPPPLGDFVLNPNGKDPDFHLRENRFVPNAEVKKAIEEKRKMVIIDARATSDWYMLRVPGSISVPYYAFERLDSMPKDGTWILAYCACPHHASGAVVDELRKRGFPRTAILDEGIIAWKNAKYPTDSDPVPPSDGAESH
jgi:mono/diheme cytochrome c family protein/rhodanese-related sulfurtransferase